MVDVLTGLKSSVYLITVFIGLKLNLLYMITHYWTRFIFFITELISSAKIISLSFCCVCVCSYSFIHQVESSYSISVPIFKQFHKNIIGKGGANIKKVSNT